MLLWRKIKSYYYYTRLVIKVTKSPVQCIVALALKISPYELTLKSGNQVISEDRAEIIRELFKANFNTNEKYYFVYNKKGFSYTIKNYNSVETMISTFVNEDWKKLNVKNKFVLDIGGYVGDTAIYFVANGAVNVIVLEAFPYSCRIAEGNVAINHLQGKIEILNYALGAHKTNIIIDPNYVNDNESSAISQSDGVEVPVTTLEDIVKKYAIKDWVMKMNCEGCEYDVFEATDIKIINTFSEIYMHYHKNPIPLVRKLEESGFKVEYDDYIHAKRINILH